MSRPIKMTEEYMNECRSDFEKALQLTKLADGAFNFTKTFSIGERKALIHFTALAWAKMTAILRDFNQEVAWHGIASRDADETKDRYIISDIVVYPQTVSSTAVEMDTEEYNKWLIDNNEDERFNHIHMQGHSHVNMAPTPSSVDLAHQEEILNMLDDTDFYIFMIWNKSLVSNTKIYDLKKNILFEDQDITYEHEQNEIEEFIKQAKEMVKTITYSPSCYGSDYQYGYIPYHSSYNPVSSVGSDSKHKGEKAENKSNQSNKNSKKDKPRTKVDTTWTKKGTLWDPVNSYSCSYSEFGGR